MPAAGWVTLQVRRHSMGIRTMQGLRIGTLWLSRSTYFLPLQDCRDLQVLWSVRRQCKGTNTNSLSLLYFIHTMSSPNTRCSKQHCALTAELFPSVIKRNFNAQQAPLKCKWRVHFIKDLGTVSVHTFDLYSRELALGKKKGWGKDFALNDSFFSHSFCIQKPKYIFSLSSLDLWPYKNEIESAQKETKVRSSQSLKPLCKSLKSSCANYICCYQIKWRQRAVFLAGSGQDSILFCHFECRFDFVCW